MKIIGTYHRKMRKPADLSELRKSESHLDLSLENVRNKLSIAHLFINKSCLKAIDQWVEQSLKAKPVAEVGGFLLGKYVMNEDGKYLTSLEAFVPAKAVERSTPIKIEFGIEPLLALDKHLEARPDLVLVGWFHTHPGHGPYLSEVDLYTHEGFFNQGHQVAIVLDPLTKHYDTGIFCRREDNTMSNKDDFSHWLNWQGLSKAKQ
jgi:proteasome lid subunit RPN8/RPN11